MDKIRQLLKETADEYAPDLGELDDHVSDKHFAKGSAFAEVEVAGDNPFKTVRDCAIDAGTILAEDEGTGAVAAMLKGGAGSTAQIMIVALVEGSTVKLGAYSREGLILQHAAEKELKGFSGLVAGL